MQNSKCKKTKFKINIREGIMRPNFQRNCFNYGKKDHKFIDHKAP